MSPLGNEQKVLELAKAALDAGTDGFVALVEEVTRMLEKEAVQVGKMLIEGKLVTLMPQGEIIIIGDIHGDLESLVYILKDSSFLQNIQSHKDITLIFLGDYGDRGFYSAEVYHIVLTLKQSFPENVILMRGNHEGPEDLLASPHDLPFQFQQRFGQNGESAYNCIRLLFNQLYNAVLVKNRYLLIHGGVPTTAGSLDDLAYAHEKHPKETFLEEILWNDPEEGIAGICASPRGAGKLFGNDITARFLEMFQVDMLIRGHEPSMEGFKLNHSGRVLTLFSRKGAPYFNEQAAYLKIDLAKEVKSADDLEPWIRRF
ncbi:MAG: metallophosphoesterase family protein [Candidatus Bathyarchaeales archaeon]